MTEFLSMACKQNFCDPSLGIPQLKKHLPQDSPGSFHFDFLDVRIMEARKPYVKDSRAIKDGRSLNPRITVQERFTLQPGIPILEF